MIDWWGVFRNTLWIVGLSIGLAAWSYAAWWAHAHHFRLRQALRMPLFIIPFSMGMALFSLGLALCGRKWWEVSVWGVLSILFGVQGAYTWHASHR